MNRPPYGIVVVFSGGQDSTTTLFWAKHHFEKVHAITFDYGQKHAIELEAAKKVAAMAEVDHHEIIKVGPILRGSSPLTTGGPVEQLASLADAKAGVQDTFVPGRNLLFLTLAANYAYANGMLDVATGVCQADFGGYPDCTQAFIDAAQAVIRKAMSGSEEDPFADFTIHTPLMDLTKAESIDLAITFNGCMKAMAYSHTAYGGEYPPIGKDHATLLRAKGFLEAGVPDPLVVRAFREGLMPLPDTLNYKNIQLEFDFS